MHLALAFETSLASAQYRADTNQVSAAEKKENHAELKWGRGLTHPSLLLSRSRPHGGGGQQGAQLNGGSKAYPPHLQDAPGAGSTTGGQELSCSGGLSLLS